MEQCERAVLDPYEVKTEEGGDAPAELHAGEVTVPEEAEQEHVTETNNPVRAASSEGSKEQDLEVIDGDSVRCATRETESEDREAFKDTIAITTHFGKASDRLTAGMHLAMAR
jgi:hypothetical protein